MHSQTLLSTIRICPAVLLGLTLLVFAACKKNNPSVAPDPFYDVTIDGLTATFANKSTGASSYKWDFGDGSSSTDASPVHTYAAKGKYVPTLYATGAGGATREASTVLHISKGSSIKLDDHSLSDWDTVTHNVVLGGGPKSGNFIRAKYDYDGNNVYIYFEQNAAKADGNIYDLYIDADNNPATGYLTNDIPNGAYDVLLEGTIFDGWLDSYYHSGDQSSFGGYAGAGLSDFYTVGTYEESGGVLRFEFALKRSKIKNLTGQGLKIGVQVAKSDWSATIGYSPDQNSSAFFMDMSQ
jgi:PKD repeat protein